VDVPWWRSGRLRPVGGDGRWGTAARARGGGEGPVRGGRGVGRGSRGAIHGGRTRAKGDAGRGTGQAGIGVGGGVRGHREVMTELGVASPGPDGDQSSRWTMGCVRWRKAGDAELTWVRWPSTCLTIGALARRQHGLTGRAPWRS
jgi:hypothetical protein